jgi:hypothetical protein
MFDIFSDLDNVDMSYALVSVMTECVESEISLKINIPLGDDLESERLFKNYLIYDPSEHRVYVRRLISAGACDGVYYSRELAWELPNCVSDVLAVLVGVNSGLFDCLRDSFMGITSDDDGTLFGAWSESVDDLSEKLRGVLSTLG